MEEIMLASYTEGPHFRISLRATQTPGPALLGGTKYMVIQGEAGAVIRGKKGSGGITVKKTSQALIFGIYEEPLTPGQCNMIVERLGDYLIDQGL